MQKMNTLHADVELITKGLIDNLEVTQTGYNACKGGTSYDI